MASVVMLLLDRTILDSCTDTRKCNDRIPRPLSNETAAYIVGSWPSLLSLPTISQVFP
jgi:hypothetical protein